MSDEIPIQISDDVTLAGTAPIVIIGPNGSGKTRYAADLAKRMSADMITAMRNTAIEDSISMKPYVDGCCVDSTFAPWIGRTHKGGPPQGS